MVLPHQTVCGASKQEGSWRLQCALAQAASYTQGPSSHCCCTVARSPKPGQTTTWSGAERSNISDSEQGILRYSCQLFHSYNEILWGSYQIINVYTCSLQTSTPKKEDHHFDFMLLLCSSCDSVISHEILLLKEFNLTYLACWMVRSFFKVKILVYIILPFDYFHSSFV